MKLHSKRLNNSYVEYTLSNSLNHGIRFAGNYAKVFDFSSLSLSLYLYLFIRKLREIPKVAYNKFSKEIKLKQRVSATDFSDFFEKM